MSDVQRLIDRQYGNCYLRNYDTAIKQLKCNENDEFQNIIINDFPSSEFADPPIFACKFAQCRGYEHILALANEEGHIAIHNTEHRKSEPYPLRFATMAHYNAIFDLAWMFGRMKLVSVSGDHTARLFDVTRSEICEQQIFHGHTRSVKTCAFRKDDPAVFATGSRDGAIFVWDTRAIFNSSHFITTPDMKITNSHNVPSTPTSGKSKKKFYLTANVSAANSVTSIVFQDDNTLISCGAGDGIIKVWDLRKNYQIHKNLPVPKYTLPYVGNSTRNGFSNLLIDCSGVKLYANCMDNNIYCYNIATYNPNPVMTYVGHQNSTFYIKSSISADGNYLISGSSDCNAYVWNTNKSTPLVSLTGHVAEVTCVAFCQKGDLKVVTCSDDMKHKIWRVYDDSHDTTSRRGEAEVIEDRPETKLLSTPSSRKRIMEYTPHSQRKRNKICENCQMLTPGSVESLSCQNCLKSGSVRSSKRTATQAEFSPNDSEKKRQREDKNAPRRLFEPSSSRDWGVLATVLEEVSPEKTFSPTANLPNFVIDGEAPHLRNYSPKKKVDKDWLTRMRVEQNLKNHLAELSNPSPPKQLKLSDANNSSPKNSNRKQKKSNASGNRAQSPLLKFFRVTNNPSRSCDQCSHLSPIHNNFQNEIRHVN